MNRNPYPMLKPSKARGVTRSMVSMMPANIGVKLNGS